MSHFHWLAKPQFFLSSFHRPLLIRHRLQQIRELRWAQRMSWPSPVRCRSYFCKLKPGTGLFVISRQNGRNLSKTKPLSIYSCTHTLTAFYVGCPSPPFFLCTTVMEGGLGVDARRRNPARHDGRLSCFELGLDDAKLKGIGSCFKKDGAKCDTLRAPFNCR